MRRNVLSGCAVFTPIVILALLCAGTPEGFAQEIPSPEVHPSDSAMPSAGEAPVTADDATVTAEVNEEGGRIVVEAKGVRPRVPTWFSAEVSGIASVGPGKMDYEFTLRLKVLQGRARVLSLGLGGDGELHDVSGDGLKAWAVRRVGPERFLDLEVVPDEKRKEFSFVVKARIVKQELPVEVSLLHLRPGSAVGFASTLDVRMPLEVSSRLLAADGFLPLESENEQLKRFEGSAGKRLAFAFSRSSAVSAPVELVNARLEGTVDETGGHASFTLRATAQVSTDNAVIDILRGQAAASEIPAGQGYHLELSVDGTQRPVYQLRFPRAGSFAVHLKIVARLTDTDEWRNLDFEVPSGAVIPIVLHGLAGENEFREDAAVVPSKEGAAWRGFLPLRGRCHLGWKPVRKTGEGKLFFTTTAMVNVGVEAGLLRQTSVVDYRILQGQLNALSLDLAGPGEVYGVDGPNVVGWSETEEDGIRRLDVKLNRPLEGKGLLRVRSQLPLEAFPVRAKPLRLIPTGSIRHSGYIRVYNIGATRLEVAGIAGLTQLSPDQFPEKNLPGGDRQVFVYRFPAVDHDYEIVADRVQPETTVLQNVVYELTETDRIIDATVQLDIREAPLREWMMMIPADYTIVSVTGAEVRDYVRGTEVINKERTLNILFNKEVAGRQLVEINLEKNQSAESGEWVLPRLRHEKARGVRGEIGLAGVPGYRLAVENSDLLTEIPISRFQKNRPGLRLQQAYRTRERAWTAAVNIQSLPQSIQADVFHLYSLRDETAYVSVILNYFITGAPVSELRLGIPPELVREDGNGGHVPSGNLSVVCNDLRLQKVMVRELSGGVRESDYILTLQKGVIGPVTVLVTFELPLVTEDGRKVLINAGNVVPRGVASESGFIQVVTPVQVNADIDPARISPGLLKLNPLELPAEYQLLTPSPPIATYQYSGTARPFDFPIGVDWYESGTTIEQVVEFLKASTQVSRVGGLVTDIELRVKTRGQRVLKTTLPEGTELWGVRVSGENETARTEVEDGVTFHNIPLPGDVDINKPVNVRLKVAKPVKQGATERSPEVTLPAIHAPISKAEWTISGEKGRVLTPRESKLPLQKSVMPESGLQWIAAKNHAMFATGGIFGLLAIGLWARWTRSGNFWISLGGIGLLVAALVLSIIYVGQAGEGKTVPQVETLEFSLPILAAEMPPSITLANETQFGARISTLGIALVVASLGLLGWSLRTGVRGGSFRVAGASLLAVGVLLQGGGAQVFYLLVAIFIVILLLPWFFRCYRQFQAECKERDKIREEQKAGPGGGEPSLVEGSEMTGGSGDGEHEKEDKGEGHGGPLPGPAAPMVLVGLLLSLGGMPEAHAQNKAKGKPPLVIPAGMLAADRLSQEWNIVEGRLKATGTVAVTGKPGDSFLLLKAPGILTSFEGERLRVSKREGSSYVISIRGGNEPGGAGKMSTVDASFAYEIQVGKDADKFAVATGPAAVQEVKVRFDQDGWEFDSPAAMRVVNLEGQPGGGTAAELLLAPLASAEIVRRPKKRDVKAEKTLFYTEVDNLYTPSPGVIDGIHQVRVRPSQGQVGELSLALPEGLTATDVPAGPVREWQFDAETRVLNLVLEPAQASLFSLVVTTQSSLDPLPADVLLAPVTVSGSAGEVGQVAVAFGPEAQPEKAEPRGMSAVNLTDFDAGLLPERQGGKAVLHRVFRYGQAGGSLALRVAPVSPEIRVETTQVLSIGDERLTLALKKFEVDISRAGVFQISFPLPPGLEVDSLSGKSLRHWTELTEKGVRYIVMHLNGQTLGKQQFYLTLSGPPPAAGENNWRVPRLEVREAQRHSGTLAIQPTTGVRLEATLEKNVTDVDPKTLEAQAENALGFRLLQTDWELRLGVTKDSPRVRADLLHTLTLREGQTRTSVLAGIAVDRASIRSLRVQLPELSEKEANSLRALGNSVNDLVQVAGEDGKPVPGLYEVQFKRRILGRLKLRIDWERTGERIAGLQQSDVEKVAMISFPTAERNSDYYVAVRAGRAESGLDPRALAMPAGWQKGAWESVPKPLRDIGNQSAPALTFKCKAGSGPLTLRVRRHAAADALNLRVERGSITTVVSPVAEPVGRQMTSVDLELEVIQRNALNVRLPEGSDLLNVMVNGESVSLVKVEGAYQFHVLPGLDDRTAKVHFIYSSPGQELGRLRLASPRLNVPLANIEWQVVVPRDYELVRNGGDLDLLGEADRPDYTLARYEEKNEVERGEQRNFAVASIERANELLTAGEQTKARSLLNSAANNYALDAASNEDARVQLNRIQQKQVIVALNTRRHRLLLDNQTDDEASFEVNDQLERAAAANPLVSHNDLRFNNEQFSAIIRGNTAEDSRNIGTIADQVVLHQRSTEPAPQTLRIAMPDEGRIYTFSRAVQVGQDVPLGLDLRFEEPRTRNSSREAIVLILTFGICVALVLGWRRKTSE